MHDGEHWIPHQRHIRKRLKFGIRNVCVQFICLFCAHTIYLFIVVIKHFIRAYGDKANSALYHSCSHFTLDVIYNAILNIYRCALYMLELLYMSCNSMPPSLPTIRMEYFGAKRAIMCSETSLQNHPDLDQSKTYSISFRRLDKRSFETISQILSICIAVSWIVVYLWKKMY